MSIQRTGLEGYTAELVMPPKAPAEFGRGFLSDEGGVIPSQYLPPQDAWLINPRTEKIDTPTDSRGLVDRIKLLERLNETLHPDYVWPKKSINPHHFHWPDTAYRSEPVGDPAVVPAVFRDLPLLKGRLPRVLENWLHIVTLPPEVPTPEVMYYTAEAWIAAKGLYECSSSSVLWSRRERRRQKLINTHPEIIGDRNVDTEAQRCFIETQEKNKRGYELYLQKLQYIPSEFRIVQPNMSPRRIADVLGILVLREAHQLTRVANRVAA